MGLFNRKQKTDNIIKYAVPYSKNFRGFKRIAVNVHGNEEAERNNSIIHKKNLSNSLFEFVFNENDGFVMIYIDGMNVGAIFDEELISVIKNKKIEFIHAEPKPNEERLTYFVKYME